MKKTNIKRIAAFTASILAVAALAVPMTSVFTADAASSITITNDAATKHEYDVYQIFTGTLADNKLGDLKWGANVATYNGAAVTAGDAVPADVVTAIIAAGNETNRDKAVSDWVSTNLTLNETDKLSATDNTALTVPSDGYYLIKDVTDLAGFDDANSTWILQVAGETTQAIKNAKPKVDKLVQDEVADMDTTSTNTATAEEIADGWSKSADHSIGETYQYKLKAEIPIDSDLIDYDEYKLVFNDTLMKGVTFEEIVSLTVNGGADLWASHGADISTSAAKGDTDKAFTFTIEDIKDYVNAGDWGTKVITVEVIYKAHLNADADIADAADDTTTNNVNKVYLEYSNNPNYTGTGDALGETTEEIVYVYTYLANGLKVKGDASGNATDTPLDGVKFKLYDAATDGNEIAVVQVEGSTYRLAIGDETGVDIVTGTDGKFVIQGLDHGTYWLEETETKPGYNKLTARQEVTLTATHSETKVESLTYSGAVGADDNANTYVIVNNEGSSLPSTGGIGTTLFYVGGGALALGAGVLLVSKKRMANK